jgi:hypothetical protein
MSYRSLRSGRLHVVRWSTPELADVDPVAYEVRWAHQELRRPVVCVAVISADAEPPTDEVRAAMSRNLPTLLSCAEHLYFVVEGQGFRHSVMRSVLATFILFGRERGKVTVHADLEALVVRLAPSVGRRTADLLSELREGGILPVLKQAG